MTRKLAALVAGLCAVWLVVLPAAALYFLVRIDDFGAMAIGNLAMPIQWYTVGNGQWYALWAITALFLALGYAGAWNLRKAFASFALEYQQGRIAAKVAIGSTSRTAATFAAMRPC